MSKTILVCHDPIGSHWQLGQTPPGGCTLSLVGWRTSSVRIDSEVPEAVAMILARAMTATTRVVFPSSSVNAGTSVDSISVDADLVRMLPAESLTERVLGRLSNVPSTIALLATRDPEAVARMFDDAAYPWSLQGQVALLSDPEQVLPNINKQELLSLLESDWMQQVPRLQSVGVRGVLRPGVDGDVAGVTCFSTEFRSRFLKALEGESRAAGFEWRMLSEADFATALGS